MPPAALRLIFGGSYSLGLLTLVLLLAALPANAQESPYIVTYDHYLEEPGSLEVEYFSTFGTQRAGNPWLAYWAEFEYGATAWWTTEIYLDAQTTFNDSTLFTGFRWENRFRLLQREHFINPVLYLEYEQTSGADKILKEVEGHDVEADYGDPECHCPPGAQSRDRNQVLLSKNFKGWNFAENTHRHQEPYGRQSLGVRLRHGRQPSSRSESLRPALQFLSREFRRRS